LLKHPDAPSLVLSRIFVATFNILFPLFYTFAALVVLMLGY
jgi:hypothetical protein